MSNVKLLGDEIYLYEGFLTKKEIKKINKKLNKSTWKKMWELDRLVPETSKKMRVTRKIAKRLEKMIDGYLVDGNETINRMAVGSYWGKHSDNEEFEKIRDIASLYKEGMDFKLIHNIKYGVVVYINDNYEGGEIYYVNQGISYKPKAGDLLVHSSEEKCMHGVRTVISGTRYAWSSNLGNQVKLPILSDDDIINL